jgi:hypothetical protein
MPRVNYASLVEHFRADAPQAGRELREALETRQIKVREFDELGSLFEACFGADAYFACRRGKMLAHDVFARALTEANGAVMTNAFQNISGQIVYSATLDKYQSEEFVFQKLIPEVATQFLDGEKIAGITQIGDEVAVRNEADPYALAGVGEDWIFTPPVKDRGVIIPVTWEAIFADRTGQLLERCGDVGYWSGQNREKRAIDCVVDENVTTHRYNWRGTTIATYGDNSGTHSWDNLAASNALVDWTDVDAAEQVFNGLTDPYTAEPIEVEPRHLIVVKALEQTARRILSATEIRVATPGYATTGNPTETHMANPYLNKYELVTSRLLAARMATDTSWFLADVTKMAKYMVAEKMQVVQAPSNNQDEFHRRIVAQYRVNERGAYVVVQPRAAVKSTA